MVMRGKAFLAFLALVLIISFSLVAALPCGHIFLYMSIEWQRVYLGTRKI